MPQPVLGDVHVNRPLTNMSVAFLQDQSKFAANSVFPGIPVPNKSDSYFVFDRSYFFRNSMKKRAPGTPAQVGAYGVSTAEYTTEVWSLMYPVADQIRANTDAPLNPDRNASNYLAQQALINREASWCDAFFKTSVWTKELAGASSASAGTAVKYWGASGSTPVDDVLDASLAIEELTGLKPNVLVLSPYVKKALKVNAQIIDRLKYGQTPGGIVTVKDSDLATLFEVDRVVTPSGIQTTSNEGAASATYAFIAGKHALLAYSAPSPGIEVPSAGYTFNWTGYLGASAYGTRIKRYRWEINAADNTEIDSAYAFAKISADLGFFFKDVVQ